MKDDIRFSMMVCIKLLTDWGQIYHNLSANGVETGFFSAEYRAIDCGGNVCKRMSDLFLLQKDKNHQLRYNHPEKHCQRIYGGIAHGRDIITGACVGI